MRMVWWIGAALLAGLGWMIAGCRPTQPEPVQAQGPPDPVWFKDTTTKVGLDFHHDPGPLGSYFMPQIFGSGAGVLLDYKHEDPCYLYLVNNGGPKGAPNRLYRWHAGRFTDVTKGSGLDVAGYGMGVAVGDFDNDGHPDIYLSQYGGGRLFHNRGDFTFEDITKQAGVELPGWGTSCCFVDYDRDGWLDLIVVHYLDYDPMHHCSASNGTRDYCHPLVFPGTALRLFHNRGKDANGKWLGFEDVTARAGVGKPMNGLGVACADFNGDGWPDILAANDTMPNTLWINRHDGTFVDEAVDRGIATNNMGEPQANMGVALGDVDGDGKLDVVITHLIDETHTLWRQTSTGLFKDCTVASGLGSPLWRNTGFGTILADFDLDGFPDLPVVAGAVKRPADPPTDIPGLDPLLKPYGQRNQLFANDGHGHFRDISRGNTAFCGTPEISRGLVWNDFYGDGRIDLVTTTIGGPALFYRNIAQKKGHWLEVRAIDPALKRDAYGAVVNIQAGKRHGVGMVNPGQSYLCSGDPRAHFGLGAAEKVDQVRIDWPDGLSEIFPGAAADRMLRLERGHGTKVTKR